MSLHGGDIVPISTSKQICWISARDDLRGAIDTHVIFVNSGMVITQLGGLQKQDSFHQSFGSIKTETLQKRDKRLLLHKMSLVSMLLGSLC